MTMGRIADEINGLFRKYGLDHDVVRVEATQYGDKLTFIGGGNEHAMELLLTTFRYVFDVYFAANPVTGQGRLF